jgi:ATP-dependent DNA ligase
LISFRDLMLATSASKPFDRPGWIFELKYDGYRCLAIRDADQARLLTRRGNDLSACFPEIIACLRILPDIVLDGELVVLDDTGKALFERLRRRALLKKRISVEHAARQEPAVLFAFDILSLRGKDLRKLPLLKRKEALQTALEGSQRIRPVPTRRRNGKALVRRRVRSWTGRHRSEARRRAVQGGAVERLDQDPHASGQARAGAAVGGVERVRGRARGKADPQRA